MTLIPLTPYQNCYEINKIITFYIFHFKRYTDNSEKIRRTSMKTEESKRKILWKLLLGTLYISAFTFGGGFVIITFMKRKFVDELHWIDENEMLDLAALAQSSPGAIAVNAAILVGWHVAGFAGMLVSVVGTIVPPMTILTVISFFYKAFATNVYVALVLKGMQAGVAAVILDVVCGLGSNVIKSRQPVQYAVMILAFVATVFWNVNVIYIILAAAAVGIVMEAGKRMGERK